MTEDEQLNRARGNVTLLDVAAAAGVSKSTVSRILDERLPRSESQTAQRVRQVAADGQVEGGHLSVDGGQQAARVALVVGLIERNEGHVARTADAGRSVSTKGE